MMPPSFVLSSELGPRLYRQMWGLVARCERAMRTIARHRRAQEASWADAASQFACLAFPASWLCALATAKTEDARSLPDAAIQLLASSVATALKAARVAGINANFQLPCSFFNIPALQQPISVMLPAAISLLLPRIAGGSTVKGASPTLLCTVKAVNSVMDMAQRCRDPELCPLMVLGSPHMMTLIDRAAAELLHCSGPAPKRRDAHLAVTTMSFYAVLLSTRIASGASQGYKEASMEPDAMDSKVAMLVGHTYYFAVAYPYPQLFVNPETPLLVTTSIYPLASALPSIYLGKLQRLLKLSCWCLQGRQLSLTLHQVYESLSCFCSDYLSEAGTSIPGLLVAIWNANCSCRKAGYSESCAEELEETWDDSDCSGLPSPMDAPSMSQAASRDSAAQVLRALRQLAGRVWPVHPATAVVENSSGSDRASYADWEVFQAELLSASSGDRSPAVPTGCHWGEGLWCFNPACTNLEGPSELALKTYACGGGCRLRYCSPECQARGWRDGHRLSCGRLRDRNVAHESQLGG